MRLCKICFCVAVIMAAVGERAALANPAERSAEAESETWIKKGVQLRKEGANAEALEAFLHALRISPNGRTVAQVGLARQTLKQWTGAANCLEEALNSHEPWVEKNRTPLEDALSAVKTHVGWLVVTGPVGARLWLNQIPMGSLPLKELRMDEGSYVARVEKEGSQPWSQTVAVPGGRIAEIVAMLEEARPAVDAIATRRPGLEVGAREGKGIQLEGALGAGIAGAGLAVATVGTVVWLQQESGSYGTFNSGGTGPALLVGGVVGMLTGSVLMYWSRERSVSLGMMGKGPALGGSF